MLDKIDFAKGGGFVPAVIQHFFSSEVLMLGYMNEEAYRLTVDTNCVTFYSRTRDKIWKKGETSGNILEVKCIAIDCDNDTLLIKAIPHGPTCHTGTTSCFGDSDSKGFLYKLEDVIEGRKNNPNEKSYTAHLFSKGTNKIAQKVGEEAVELVIEAMDNDDNLFLNEASDLMYHYLVLLQQKGYKLADIEKMLSERHK